MPRLFVEALPGRGAHLRLRGEDQHHLQRVLRLRAGDLVHLVSRGDPGTTAVARVVGQGGDAMELEVVEFAREELPPRPRVTLFQGMPKGDKMDLIVQKATELGVSRIVPCLMRRSVALPDLARSRARRARWQRIATSAAQQSRRRDVPEVAAVAGLADALAEAARTTSLKVLLHEGARARGPSLRQVLPAVLPDEIHLLVGPEGGFDADETSAAVQAGFVSCGLGQRVLRTETTALCVLGIIAYLSDM